MSIKKFAAAGMGVMLALSMAACSNSTSNPGTTPNASDSGSAPASAANADYSKDVGVVLSDASQPRWVMAQSAFQAAMPGVQIKFSNNDTSVEKTNVDSFIAAGVKVLVINSIDGVAAAAEVEDAHSAGIPVIAYDRLIMGTSNLAYYATFDSLAVGKAQGQYLVDQAGSTKGNNLYLFAGDVGDNNAFLFFQGAWSVLQPKIADGTFTVVNSPEAIKYENTATLTHDQEAEIMQPITTLWDPTKAKQLAESALAAASTAQKGTVYMLAPNDQTSCAMTDAFRADAAVKTIYSTGQDLALYSVQYILDGKQSMTVFKSDKTLVAQTKSLVDSILANTTPDPSIVTTTYDNHVIKNGAPTGPGEDVPSTAAPIVTVTKDNITQVVNDSGLYTITDGVAKDKS
jgi:putative multiple sugar transport system substrate-binding protein